MCRVKDGSALLRTAVWYFGAVSRRHSGKVPWHRISTPLLRTFRAISTSVRNATKLHPNALPLRWLLPYSLPAPTTPTPLPGSPPPCHDTNARFSIPLPAAGLLATQLALTTLIAGSIVFAAPVRAFVESNPAVMSVAALVSIAIVLGFSFSPSARQSHPLNLVLLFAFTAAEGVLVGAVSCQAATDVVVLAFGITAGVTVGLVGSSEDLEHTQEEATEPARALAGRTNSNHI